MSIALSTVHADAAGAALPDDHRIALLTARTALEPELAKRYTEDPYALLAEFGLPAAEPVYGTVARPTGERLVIEDLDRPDVNAVGGCNICWGDLLVSAAEAAGR